MFTNIQPQPHEVVHTFSAFFKAGWKLMRLVGIDDLRKRLSPRLDKFHTNDTSTWNTGVTYWKKTYLYQDYCEARNGYVCQRPAAAGAASDGNGTSFFLN
jgi:hypothetical protein